MSDDTYGESPSLKAMREQRKALHEIAMGPMRKKWPEEADAYNWTAEELAIMKRGGSVPVVVNGTVFQARMPRDAKR